jgi:diphthamide synthase (EF-2-diphthine--ammonia ligase)
MTSLGSLGAGLVWKRNFVGGMSVPAEKTKPDGTEEINLEQVAQLIEALEQDLAKVRSGSRDMQLLRDEVETLKNVLNSPVRRHHWVKDGLHSIRGVFENALDKAIVEGLKGSQYISEIGRILGL